MATDERERIHVECDQCGGKFRVSADAVGRKARCPKCDHVFTIEDRSALALASEEPTLDDSSTAFVELARQEHFAARDVEPTSDGTSCPRCGATMSKGSALCVSCGYNTVTGKSLTTKVKGAGLGGALSGLARRAGTFPIGCALSAAGALAGAGVWIGVAVATEYEIGWIAWGLGCLAGCGMAFGYRKQNVKAGLAACGFALVGILIAKGGLFWYVNHLEIKEAQRQIAMIGTDSWFEYGTLADKFANRRADELGLSPSDERREEFYDQEWDRLMAASEADFEEAVREDEEWEAGAKWDDSQYVRDYLLYARIETERQARADQAGDESDDPAESQGFEHEFFQLSPRDWRSLYKDIKRQLDELSPEEQLVQARASERQNKRSEQIEPLAYHFGNLDTMRQGVPLYGEEGDKNIEAQRTRFEAMSDQALTDATVALEAWEDGGRIDDAEYVRDHLVYVHIREAISDRNGDEEDLEMEGEEPTPEEWSQYYRDAVAVTDALAPEECRQRIEDEQSEIERFRESFNSELRAEASKQVTGNAFGIFVESSFGLIDILFVLFALGSAFKLGTGREED